MTLNIWRGGEAAAADPARSRRWTAAALRAARADVVAVQETDARTPAYADELGLRWCRQGPRTGVPSALGITRVRPDGHVTVRLPSGRDLHVLNVHLPPAPYQPYQLAGIPYEGGRRIHTAAEAIDEALRARGEETARIVTALRRLVAGDAAVVLTGDFNEPSHLDWTARAADAGVHALEVAWPASTTLAAIGMTDAYRRVFPDEVRRRGDTWTARPRRREVADRIDRIYYAGPITPIAAAVVGEDAEHADVVVTPWPSDHRGVVVTFTAASR